MAWHVVTHPAAMHDGCAGRFDRSCCDLRHVHALQGSATLSMAYAGALFADACLRGLNGDSNVVEPTFVESKITELPFFASKVRLGPSGDCGSAAQHRQLSMLPSTFCTPTLCSATTFTEL